MQFNNLKRHTKRATSVSVGRGGKRGKTSGRGGKGQTARAGAKVRPEMRDIIKRLPKLRGRGKSTLKSFTIRPIQGINLDALELVFKSGAKVSPTTLAAEGLITTFNGKNPAVKILGDGEITKKIIVSGCTVSASARAKIEKAGGEIKA